MTIHDIITIIFSERFLVNLHYGLLSVFLGGFAALVQAKNYYSGYVSPAEHTIEKSRAKTIGFITGFSNAQDLYKHHFSPKEHETAVANAYLRGKHEGKLLYGRDPVTGRFRL